MYIAYSSLFLSFIVILRKHNLIIKQLRSVFPDVNNKQNFNTGSNFNKLLPSNFNVNTNAVITDFE